MDQKSDYPNIEYVYSRVKIPFPEFQIDLVINKNFGKLLCNKKLVSKFDCKFLESQLSALGTDAIEQTVSVMVTMVRRKFITRHYKRKGGHGSNAFLITENLIKFARANSKSVAGAARFLGVCDNTFRKYAIKHGVYEGMTNMSGAGISKGWNKEMHRVKLEDIFANKHPYYPLKTLKKRLLSQYLIEDKCNVCGYDKIRKRDLASPLDLRFKDKQGDYSMDNLHLVCKNCQYVMDDRYKFIFLFDKKLKSIQELKVRNYDQIWEEYNADLRKSVIAKNPDSEEFLEEDGMNKESLQEIIDADTENTGSDVQSKRKRSKKEDLNNPDTSGMSSIWNKWNQ